MSRFERSFMKQFYTSCTRHSEQTGFTLVELMVSLVVSLLVGLSAMSSLQFFNGMKRQSTGISASVANALTAFSAIKYEAGQAGLGFFNAGKFACSGFNIANGTIVTVNNAPLLPVQITLAAGVPTLNLYYASALESAGATTLFSDTASTDTAAQITTFLPVVAGQEVVLAPSTPGVPCALKTVTGVDGSLGSGQVLHFDASGKRNQAAFPAASYLTGDAVMLAGAFTSAAFTLDASKQLVLTRPLENPTPVVLAKNVVAIAFQYGVTAPGGAVVVGWRYPQSYPNLSPGAEDWSTLTAATLFDQVKAVRVAVVMRSDHADKKGSDGTCSTTATMPKLLGTTLGETPDGMAAGANVTTALTGDWTCYRYAETSIIVPLRNLTTGRNT